MDKNLSLAEIRNAIDNLDTQIVTLISQRQKLVKHAAQWKKDEEAVRAPDRVEQVIANVREKATIAGASPDIAESVYRTMIQAFITFELEEHAHTTPQSQTET